MRNFLTKFLVLILASPLLVFLFLEAKYFMLYSEHKRAANVFELSQNHKGWALIEYGNSNCPQLLEVKNKIFHTISESGFLCTSTILKPGYGPDEYLFKNIDAVNLLQDANTGVNQIWHEDQILDVRDGNKFIRFYYFYVGDKLVKTKLENDKNQIRNFLSQSKSDNNTQIDLRSILDQRVTKDKSTSSKEI
jgi:hypothetical protein